MRVKIHKIGAAMLLAGLLGTATAALADTVQVPGTANPFYAGRDDTAGDGTVPPQSTIAVVPGAVLTFKVKGGANFQEGCPDSCYPTDGDGGSYQMTNLDDSTGIAGINNVPGAALIGVFLNDRKPKPGTAPARRDLSVDGLDFKRLKPKLRQMFFIGDGRYETETGRHRAQKIIVPRGATRLFLAVSDGSGWFNNSGEIDATVTQTLP
jgi:hypothetical protein